MTTLRLTRIRSGLTLFLALMAAFALVAVPVVAANVEKDHEVEMGKEGAKEVEKDSKIVTDPAICQRVERIGQTIAAVANSIEVPAAYGDSKVVKYDFTFKVIEDKDVNAFSLPGGPVYINTGLLDAVQSDSELAGVLAHEISHAAHHHMVKLLKEQSKVNNQIAIALLVGIVSKMPQRDLSNAVLGLQLYQTAKTSGYGQKAEADADHTAILYLSKTEYSPVGVLTFIERLARKPELVTMGIFQTHPPSRDRAKWIIAQLEEMKIPINRRTVTQAIKAESRTVEADGREYTTVYLDGQPLCRIAAGDGKTAEERASSFVAAINRVLDGGLQLREVRLGNGPAVVAKNEQLVMLTETDAEINGRPAMDIATDTAKALKRVVWKQQIEQLY